MWAPLAEANNNNRGTQALPPEHEHLILMPIASPWRRFFARLIDFWGIGLPTSLFVAYTLSSFSPSFALWIQMQGSEYVFGWLLTPLILAIEGVIFGFFGTTVGKYLLGLKVTTASTSIPTASQYFQRLAGVYWYGLGTGFPLITLFTMARQHGRLKAEKQADYDEGKFEVKATKLKPLRIISAFVVVVVAIFFANALLQSTFPESTRSYYSAKRWTNEVTGRSVTIPRGWIYEKQQNDVNQPVHIFSWPEMGLYIVFAKEDIHPSLKISEYVNAWIDAVQSTMRLSPSGQPVLVNGHPALRVAGSLSNDKTQRVVAILVKKGRQVWRIVQLGMSGRDPASPAALKLQEMLFASIE